MFWPARQKISFGCGFLILLFLMINFGMADKVVYAQQWQEEKSKHFLIRFSLKSDRTWARRVLRSAEKYYDRIADQIGYTRYQNFWTWDDRVVISVYPDQKTFVRETGQPEWSLGGAIRDNNVIRSKQIVTFKQENKFMDGVLPHEISHLMIRDFIGFDRDIPIWFDEGVAQLQEKDKVSDADRLMKKFVAIKQYIPLAYLNVMKIRNEQNPAKVFVYYAQSVSLVNYLIKTFGSRDFGRLCRGLKNGKSFEGALRAAYVSRIENIQQLEEKWLRYMSY